MPVDKKFEYHFEFLCVSSGCHRLTAPPLRYTCLPGDPFVLLPWQYPQQQAGGRRSWRAPIYARRQQRPLWRRPGMTCSVTPYTGGRSPQYHEATGLQRLGLLQQSALMNVVALAHSDLCTGMGRKVTAARVLQVARVSAGTQGTTANDAGSAKRQAQAAPACQIMSSMCMRTSRQNLLPR